MEKLAGITRVTLAAGAVLTMAHEVLTSKVEAAGPVCDPNKKDYPYTIVVRRVPFFDFGGRGIFDSKIDPWFEVPVTGGSVRAEDSSGKILSERSYTVNQPNVPKELNFKPKQGETNVAWSILGWKGDCGGTVTANTPSGKTREIPSKKVRIVASEDPKNKTLEVTAAAGGLVDLMNGKEIKTPEQLLDWYRKHPQAARNLPPQVLEDIRQAAAKEKGVVLPKVSPTPYVPKKLDDKRELEFSWTAAAIAFAGLAISAGLAYGTYGRRRGG